MPRRPVQLGCLLALPLLSGGAVAQDEFERFRLLEPGFEDVSPNAVRDRMYQVDLRTPQSFEQVYEIVDSAGLLARRHGSVTAVFSRSEYAGNATPMVPAGTVFYLGSLPVNLSHPGMLTPLARTVREPGSPLGRAMRVRSGADQRAETRVDPRQPSPDAPAVGRTEGHIFESEAYRRSRVSEIVRTAQRRLHSGRGLPSGG